jgi:hypothetical protein
MKTFAQYILEKKRRRRSRKRRTGGRKGFIYTYPYWGGGIWPGWFAGGTGETGGGDGDGGGEA